MEYNNELNRLFNEVKKTHEPDEIGVMFYSNGKTGEFKRFVDGNPVNVVVALGTLAMEVIKACTNDLEVEGFTVDRYVSFLISWARKICPYNTTLTKLYEVIEKEIPYIKDYLED